MTISTLTLEFPAAAGRTDRGMLAYPYLDASVVRCGTASLGTLTYLPETVW